MIKHGLILSLLLASNLSHAAFNGLSIHSRANCVNNESISWDMTKKREMYTISDHCKMNKKRNGCEPLNKAPDDEHYIDTEREIGIRSAGVHWGEGTSGNWAVLGVHEIKDPYTGTVSTYFTSATGCNLYDGWWNT